MVLSDRSGKWRSILTRVGWSGEIGLRRGSTYTPPRLLVVEGDLASLELKVEVFRSLKALTCERQSC